MAQKQGTTKKSNTLNPEAVCDIPVEQIVVGERIGTIDWNLVDAIATTMMEDGQHHPIEVVARGKKFKLIDGAHRLAAVKHNGGDTIRAEIVKATPLQAKLREIDATLIRRKLNALNRAIFLAERKAVYEQLHPETKAGVAGALAKHGSANDTMSFAETTAEKIGLSPRSIERAVRICNHIDPVTRDRLHGTKLATKQSELLALANQGPKVQAQILDHIEKKRAGSVRAALKIVEGHAKLDTDAKGAVTDSADKQFQKLTEAWRRASVEAKRRFIAHLRETKDYGAFLSNLAEDPNAFELMRSFSSKNEAA